jgi:endonuclease III
MPNNSDVKALVERLQNLGGIGHDAAELVTAQAAEIERLKAR